MEGKGRKKKWEIKQGSVVAERDRVRRERTETKMEGGQEDRRTERRREKLGKERWSTWLEGRRVEG